MLIENLIFLYRNYNFAQCLPTGLVCLATNQIAGRGNKKRVYVYLEQ